MCAESAGIPLPGGTALLAAGVLAADGRLDVAIIVLIGICATIVGANASYAVGHHFGSKLLTAPGPFATQRLRVLNVGQPVAKRYGWIAVLLNPSFPVVPNYAPLMAGTLRMVWGRFLLWSSIGNAIWVLIYVIPGYLIGVLAGTAQGLLIIFGAKLCVFLIVGAIHYARRRPHR